MGSLGTMRAFRHVPVHLQRTVSGYRKLPRFCGIQVLGWSHQTPLSLHGLSLYQTHVFVTD